MVKHPICWEEIRVFLIRWHWSKNIAITEIISVICNVLMKPEKQSFAWLFYYLSINKAMTKKGWRLEEAHAIYSNSLSMQLWRHRKPHSLYFNNVKNDITVLHTFIWRKNGDKILCLLILCLFSFGYSMKNVCLWAIIF